MNIEHVIENSKAFQELLSAKGCIALNGLPPTLAQIVLPLLAKNSGKKILFIASNDYFALNTHINIPNSVYLPMRETLLRPAELGRETTVKRIEALRNVDCADVVCTSINALRQRLVDPELFYASFEELIIGQEIPGIETKLVQMGYDRVELAQEVGEFAIRGDIVDICTYEGSYHIERFGDEIEKMTHERVTIPPMSEFLLSPDQKKKLISYLTQEEKKSSFHKVARYAELIQEERVFDDLRNMTHVVYEHTFFDYMGDCICVLDGINQIVQSVTTFDDEYQESMKSALTASYALSGMEDLHYPFEAVLETCLGHKLIDINKFESTKKLKYTTHIDFGAKKLPTYSAKQSELIGDISLRCEHGYRVICSCGSASRAQTLSKALNDAGLFGVTVTDNSLSDGFELSGEKLIVLGEANLYGQNRSKHKTNPKKASEDFFDNIAVGDIIVHDLHGKGRYVGMETKTVAGIVRDYIVLQYREGDKLYLPVDQAGRITKYLSGSDTEPKLNKLGGKEWENSKVKAKSALKDLAVKLFSLYQSRMNAKGYMFSPDTVWQQEFEDAFDYEETPGQLQVLSEIKADMENGRAMDRLLLGDVGYGKTEVAMRACFKAAMDEKQCCVLAPTTLLAAQHYETFKKRFEGFPVNIASLSRFATKKEATEALKGIREGTVDIAIGTHRLLSKDVKFADLGLLVIDEEHRFGVAHKERIKEIKTNVDVLSLSATPIPRTLEMSLIGIRNLSTIDTPIEERIPINTYVMEFSFELAQEAILKECARGGQVFFVCRRISTLQYISGELLKLMPDVRMRIAHGQMEKHELEKAMEDFLNREFDVLLSTTIVESGLDIKNANTIIIYEADKFGISELYQLKGRVGRSSATSYAYLTFVSEMFLSQDAQKRLNALRDFTEFGSGLKVAMRDLEIRGAGNLLGPEQSGHMQNVGYEMYLRMMKEAVGELKGEESREEPECSIELNMDAHLTFITDDKLRIEYYKKIAAIRSKGDAANILNEMEKRFKEVPPAAKNLVSIALLRRYAQVKNIASIIRKSESVEIIFHENAMVNSKRLIEQLKEYDGARLLPKQPMTIVLKMKSIVELFVLVSQIDCNLQPSTV